MWLRGVAIVGLCVGGGCGRIGFADRASDASTADGASANDATGDTRDAYDGAITLVQALGPGYVNASTTSVALTHGSGDLLIAGVYWNQVTNPLTLANTLGSTWSSLPSQIVASGCDVCGASNGQIYYTVAGAAGADTITLTQETSTCPLGLFVLDYTGLSTIGIVDAGEIATSSGSAMSTPPLTVDGESLIVDLSVNTRNTGVIAAGSGYDILVHDDIFFSAFEVEHVTAGTYTPTATLPELDSCWSMTAAAFHL